MALIKNLIIDQGTSFAATITVTDPILLASLALETSSIHSQIRKSAFSTVITEEFHCTYNAETSQIIIYLTDTETAAIYPGRYEYDVLVVDPTRNSKIKIMGGTVILDSTITKING